MRHAIILAGGGGTRLWPASRRARPKQVLPLGPNGETLLATTLRRLDGLLPRENVVLVTGQATTPAGYTVLQEPCGRNTAAAIGWGTSHILARDPDACLAALPSDHVVGDEKKFAATVRQAFETAEDSGRIVTIGQLSVRPEPGYGYLEVEGTSAVRQVVRFVEKPDRDTAERFVASGRYLWNSGMFFARASVMLRAIGEHLPELAAGLSALARDPSRLAQIYPTLPSISIDYGVMEKTSDLLAVVGDFGWNDVGSWGALAELRPADERGNVGEGKTAFLDAANNVAVTDEGLIALVGVEGLVVVRAGNAVLVVPKDRAQDVRELVRLLEMRGLDDYL